MAFALYSRKRKTASAPRGLERRFVWTDNLSRSDMRLIRKAIANGWDVPPEARARIVDGVMAALDRGHTRTTLAVGRTAVAMEGENIRRELCEHRKSGSWPTVG